MAAAVLACPPAATKPSRFSALLERAGHQGSRGQISSGLVAWRGVRAANKSAAIFFFGIRPTQLNPETVQDCPGAHPQQKPTRLGRPTEEQSRRSRGHGMLALSTLLAQVLHVARLRARVGLAAPVEFYLQCPHSRSTSVIIVCFLPCSRVSARARSSDRIVRAWHHFALPIQVPTFLRASSRIARVPLTSESTSETVCWILVQRLHLHPDGLQLVHPHISQPHPAFHSSFRQPLFVHHLPPFDYLLSLSSSASSLAVRLAGH